MLLIHRIMSTIIVLLFSLLIFSVTLQVIARMVGFASPWAMELATYTFVWLVFLGGYFTIRKGINITFDLIIDSLPDKAWKVTFTIVNLVSCGFLVLMAIYGAKLAINMGSVSPVLQIPMSIVGMAIPIGGVVMLTAQLESYYVRIKKRNETLC